MAFSRGRSFRDVWTYARSPGYKRSPSGFKQAFGDVADSIPGMMNFLNVSLGRFHQVPVKYRGRHAKGRKSW